MTTSARAHQSQGAPAVPATTSWKKPTPLERATISSSRRAREKPGQLKHRKRGPGLGVLVPKWETKLKLGRKLEGVDAGTASDNQVSVLFRHDEQGNDAHVSLSIESDKMTADDVAAVFELLAQRGIFTRENTKIWVSQPQSSEARFGPTMTWKGADVKALSQRLKNPPPPTHGHGGM